MENKKKDILILGSNGMMGHVLQKYLEQQGHAVIGFNRKNTVDFNNYTELINAIIMDNPEIIINCAGILKPTNNIKEFNTINAGLPHVLADFCRVNKKKLISISTNCVYKDLGPHTADEIPNALDYYGMSKACGEVDDQNALTIRTSITGPELKKDGKNLFNWFVNNSPEELTGFTNAWWNGVTTLQLSKFIGEIINDYGCEGMTGIINYYTEEKMNKADLLETISSVYSLKKKINREEREGVHSSLLDGPLFADKNYEEQFSELKSWYGEAFK